MLLDGHAAAIVTDGVEKPTDNRSARALCYPKRPTLILRKRAARRWPRRPPIAAGTSGCSTEEGVKHGHEWLTGVFRCPIPASGKWGKMLMNCRGAGIPANGKTLVGMSRRPESGIDFEAVRTAIGAALRTRYSEILREPIPDRMAELLRELDRPQANGQDAGEA